MKFNLFTFRISQTSFIIENFTNHFEWVESLFKIIFREKYFAIYSK